MTILKGWAYNIRCETSLLKSHECGVKVDICGPSPLKVTSLNELTIFEWGVKP